MVHYDGPKAIMEVARAVAATGLKDESADQQFDTMLSSLDDLLEPAFHSLVAFAMEGNDG